MSTTIAVAGKGGTGKTTISALLSRLLAERGTVLAIDADPSVNLHMALGLDMPETIGDIREEMIPSAGGSDVPPGMSRHDYMELRTRQALLESTGLDLLAMGRPEGPGCYCAANHVLRLAIDRLTDSYDYVIIDNEAGMEHISRRTTRDVNYLLLVSDPTVRGITAAGRAQELVGDLRTNVDGIYLVINRVDGVLPPEVEKAVHAFGLKLLLTIPSDAGVGELDAGGRPIVDLPADSQARNSVRRLAQELGLIERRDENEAALTASTNKGVTSP